MPQNYYWRNNLDTNIYVQARIEKLRKSLADNKFPAMLITDLLNVRYLSGFTGTFAVLIISDDQPILLTDSRYTEQAGYEAPLYRIEKVDISWIESVRSAVSALGLKQIAFEAGDLKYSDWSALTSALKGCKLIPSNGLVEQLRMIKDAEEIQLLRMACHITDRACKHVLNVMRPGMTELAAALEIDYFM